MGKTSRDLADVVGANVRRLRASSTMETLAVAGQQNGMKLNSGTVANIEAGRFKPTLTILVLLADALAAIQGRHVGIHDLVAATDPIGLSANRAIVPGDLVKWLAGGDLALTVVDTDTDAEYVADIERWAAGKSAYPVPKVDKTIVEEVVAAQTISDERVARTLELPNVVLASWSAALWGQTFTARRDELAGPDANAQKRGRITRELKTELQQAMSAHGND